MSTVGDWREKIAALLQPPAMPVSELDRSLRHAAVYRQTASLIILVAALLAGIAVAAFGSLDREELGLAGVGVLLAVTFFAMFQSPRRLFRRALAADRIVTDGVEVESRSTSVGRGALRALGSLTAVAAILTIFSEELPLAVALGWMFSLLNLLEAHRMRRLEQAQSVHILIYPSGQHSLLNYYLLPMGDDGTPAALPET